MGGSRFIRVAAAAVAVVLVVFVIWWLYLTRSVREGDERAGSVNAPGSSPARTTSAADSLAAAKAARARVESLITQNRMPSRTDRLESVKTAEPAPGGAVLQAPGGTTGVAVSEGGESPPAGAAASPPAGESARAAPTRSERSLSTADSIYFAETLDEFADQYIIHVSSFKGMDKAREESRDLIGWGYPVFIYRVDLGSKGTWYRVYVGPYATRERATEHKIKLDENPRIKSTRISKVPG
jgi:cell division septation protein DedD